MRGAVFANQASGKALFESPLLIGSADVADSELLTLTGPAGGQKSLVLVSDPAMSDRPRGADPLDIRDHVDWLEPVLALDVEALKSEVQNRIPGTVPAWEGWTVSVDAPGKLRITTAWEAYDQRHRPARRDIVGLGGALRLKREIKVTHHQNYLALNASYQAGQAPTQVQVLIDGRMVGEFSPVQRTPDRSVDVWLVPLAKYRGKTVQVEVVCQSSGENSALAWRELDFKEDRTETRWQVLMPASAVSTADTKLFKQVDGSVIAAVTNPEYDCYTIVADTKLTGMTAFRLEALTDQRLPQRGPGRAGNGNFRLSDFKVTAAPLDQPDKAVPVQLVSAAADMDEPQGLIGWAIDETPDGTAWGIGIRPDQSRVAVFTTRQDIGYAAGTRLTFVLNQHNNPYHNLGRVRLSATSAERPVMVERPGVIVPVTHAGVLDLLADPMHLLACLNGGEGDATAVDSDRRPGEYCLKITGKYRQIDRLPNLAARIRENPGPGEYRFVRFAWKKQGGKSICLQLAHDGAWGGDRKYRYHAGSGPCFDGSTAIGETLPEEWTVVTRDLFADFGDFTLTGLSFGAIDGDSAEFDTFRLGKTLADLDSAE